MSASRPAPATCRAAAPTWRTGRRRGGDQIHARGQRFRQLVPELYAENSSHGRGRAGRRTGRRCGRRTLRVHRASVRSGKGCIVHPHAHIEGRSIAGQGQ